MIMYGTYVLFFDDKSSMDSGHATLFDKTSSKDKFRETVYLKENSESTESESAMYSPLSKYPGFRDDDPEGREKDRNQQMIEE